MTSTAPEGDINELPGGILDALIAAREQHLDSLPLWHHGLFKYWEFQVLHWLHHSLHALDDQVNALQTRKAYPRHSHRYLISPSVLTIQCLHCLTALKHWH